MIVISIKGALSVVRDHTVSPPMNVLWSCNAFSSSAEDVFLLNIIRAICRFGPVLFEVSSVIVFAYRYCALYAS